MFWPQGETQLACKTCGSGKQLTFNAEIAIHLECAIVSLGGLFVETSQTRPVGVKANLHFLVQEGQIRAVALVRHATATSGLGLKFLIVKEADRSNLVIRLRTLLRSSC